MEYLWLREATVICEFRMLAPDMWAVRNHTQSPLCLIFSLPSSTWLLLLGFGSPRPCQWPVPEKGETVKEC